MQKTPKPSSPRHAYLLALWTALMSAALNAQSTTPPAAADQPAREDDETIELAPFVVTSEEDEGYRATSTLAGTRIRSDLRDIGSSISVVTREFMRDFGTTNQESLLRYTLGTEISGINGNFGGMGDSQVPVERDILLRPEAFNRVRGLSAADTTRDFFLSDIPWDSYIVDRVDIQRGPNAILFGLGAPGGIINASLDQAVFKDQYEVQFGVKSYGGFRGTFDVNEELLDDELAIRLEALHEKTYFRQDPAFKKDERIYAALKYEPKFLARNGAKTSIRLNYEKGKIDSNNPRMLPPTDAFTPWFWSGPLTTPDGRVFNTLNKKTFDWRYHFLDIPSIPDTGVLVLGHPNFQPTLSRLRLFGGPYAFFDSPSAGTPMNNLMQMSFFLHTEGYGIGPNGQIDGNVRFQGTTDRWANGADAVQMAQNLVLPFSAGYKNRSLTDTSIYDFYNLLLDGPNKEELREFDNFSVGLSQTFLNNRLGIDLGYNRQRYDDFTWVLQFPGIGEHTGQIYVDVNNNMPDGSPNPNVGRPYIITRSEFGMHGGNSYREDYRATAFADIRATDFLQESRLTKILGRHVFTAARTESQHDHEAYDGLIYGLADTVNNLLSNNNLIWGRSPQIVSYLGPDMRNLTSPVGLNLSNIKTRQELPSTIMITGFDSHWNKPTNPSAAGYVNPATVWVNPINGQILTESENPANYVGWVTRETAILDSRKAEDRHRLTRGAQKGRTKTKSNILVWQGHLFDGMVVPTFGYREDDADSFAVTAPTDPVHNNVDRRSPNYVFKSTPDNTVSGTTRTYSVVVHAPKWLKRRLPAGLDFDLFYNKASNFQPAAGRVDAMNNPVSEPSAETKEMGFLVSAMDGRVSLRINKYESAAKDASLGLANIYMLGAIETRGWVAAKRLQAGLSGQQDYVGSLYNYGSIVNGAFVQTAADRALQQQHVDYVLANLNYDLLQIWKYDVNDNSLWQLNRNDLVTLPLGMTATADTVSEGYEAEMYLRPTQNWDITINVAKAVAQRANIAGNMKELIESQNAVWSGPGGDIRSNPVDPLSALRNPWNTVFYQAYLLQTLQEGTNVPEIRPWRVNAATSYRFTSGRLKGLAIGGGYRWQDKVGIGYESVIRNINGANLETFDIDSPYYGPKEDALDLWAAYTRPLGRRVTWRIQFNVSNALGKPKLIPLNINPDGTPGGMRILEGANWMLNNTFSF